MRYRVTNARAYVVFPDGTKVKAGKLIPKDIEVDPALVDVGWVEAE